MKVKLLSEEQKKIRRRILEISYQSEFSHLGSCLSAVDSIDAVYRVKKKNEKFVLSNGHAGVALYVILEKYGLIKDPDILKNLHVHPDRNEDLGIHVSTGSLGQGLPIALGIALADRSKNVYCMISDGECPEGSVWEALRVAKEQRVSNLKVILNANGWGAYDPIAIKPLTGRFKGFGWAVKKVNGHNIEVVKTALKFKRKNKPLVIIAETTVNQLPFLKGQDAHYCIMSKEDYMLAMEMLK